MNDHQAESLVVTCIDFRLQEAINNWISRNFPPKTFDRVAFGGGVKNLDTVLGQIDIAVRLHHVKKVVLINHEDCGAYGQENIPDHQAEALIHRQDLNTASQKIREQFPSLGVESYFLHLDRTFDNLTL